jgi:hypothetical protein
VRISYTNAEKAQQIAELRVNGGNATRIAFPSTGGDKTVGAIWIEEVFDRQSANNTLWFAPISGPGLRIESIAVEEASSR